MSVYVSVCQSVFLYVRRNLYMSVHISIYLSICITVCLYIFLSVFYFSVCYSVFLNVLCFICYQSIRMHDDLSLCHSDYLSRYLSVYISFSLYVYLSDCQFTFSITPGIGATASPRPATDIFIDKNFGTGTENS